MSWFDRIFTPGRGRWSYLPMLGFLIGGAWLFGMVLLGARTLGGLG